jgi:type III secretion protein L
VTKVDRTSPWPDLPVSPTSSIVPPDQAEAWNNAFACLKAAQARAGMIENAARDAFQAARERGYADGYRAGLSEGQKAVSEQVADTSVRVSRYLSSIDRKVADTVMAAVRGVLGHFPETDLVTRAVTHAMRRLRDAEAVVVVYVHPDLAAEVGAALQTLAARAGGSLRIAVEADPSLPSRASAVVKTPFTKIDVSIDGQLAVLERILRAPPGGPRETPG